MYSYFAFFGRQIYLWLFKNWLEPLEVILENEKHMAIDEGNLDIVAAVNYFEGLLDNFLQIEKLKWKYFEKKVTPNYMLHRLWLSINNNKN